MSYRLACLTILVMVGACGDRETARTDDTAAAPPDTPSTATVSPDSVTITPDGWGPLRIGMTLQEVVAAAGPDANPGAVGGPNPDECDEFRPERAPEGLLVMIEDGILTRITISRGTGIGTPSGIQVGDLASAVEAAHGGNAITTPHKYQDPPARYIAVWRTAPPSTEARGIIYEIGQDNRVAHIHAGGASIEYVEGCL